MPRPLRTVLVILLSAPSTFGDEGRNEMELFATDAGVQDSAGSTAEPPPINDGVDAGSSNADTRRLLQQSLPTTTSEHDKFVSELETSRERVAPDDPLRIGGLLYLRAGTTGLKDQSPRDFSFDSPSLLDVYLDGRPNDRVRGFVLLRTTFDAALAGTSGGASLLPTGPSAFSSTSGSGGLSTTSNDASLGIALDQMWIRFDVARTVFVTLGRQHDQWGVAHFWMPTDYLHQQPRNLLDAFDSRTGTTMVKLHVPVESKAWNFFAYGVLEDPNGAQTLGSLAGAARAQIVLGLTELSAGLFARTRESPKFAADLSTGIGAFDFYGELAFVDSGEVDRVRFDPRATVPAPAPPPSWQSPADAQLAQLEQAVGALFPTYRDTGYLPQGVAGLRYSHNYGDNDALSVGAEYFYNGLGYSNSDAYPGLALPRSIGLANPPSFFYLGRQYAALFVTVPAPFSLNLHTFTLSTLGNLSDRSFLTRVDYSLILLTHLTFEAFASVHYGSETGEMRLGVNSIKVGDVLLSRAPTLMDFGVALRLPF